jgi:hypothetical protein
MIASVLTVTSAASDDLFVIEVFSPEHRTPL